MNRIHSVILTVSALLFGVLVGEAVGQREAREAP
jgi:hypothetical protein